ncbi:MAG: hypothetical protein H7067_05150, partial [Burkholderiales bacterium]|nr:hypothetical protein [Opitutaceae bacterium]
MNDRHHTPWSSLAAAARRAPRDVSSSHAADLSAPVGWVQKVENNAALVNDYVAGVNAGKDVLVVAPTHAEADEVTGAIRMRLQDDGKLGTEERLFEQLVPLNWTEAEKGDLGRY